MILRFYKEYISTMLEVLEPPISRETWGHAREVRLGCGSGTYAAAINRGDQVPLQCSLATSDI